MIGARACRRYLLLAALVMGVLWAELQLFDLSPKRPRPMMLPPVYAADSENVMRPISEGPNIFFIDATCAFQEQEWKGLSTRQSCAVESALHHNPDTQVYVLHTCVPPAGGDYVPKGAVSLYTPLEFFFGDTDLSTSIIELRGLFGAEYSTRHAQDILSVLTLWKYGGAYFSMDFVILRSLLDLGEDWVVTEEPQKMSVRALSMSSMPMSPGQQVAAEMVRRLHEQGGAPGGVAELLSDVLLDRCALDLTVETEDCEGFSLVLEELLLPLPSDMWEHLFRTDMGQETVALVEGAFAVCFFDEVSSDWDPSPTSAISLLAKDNCPATFAAGFPERRKL